MRNRYSSLSVRNRIATISLFAATAVLGLMHPAVSFGDDEEASPETTTEFSGLFGTGLFGTEPFAGQGNSSASATFYTGTVDRGQIHLPIKNDFSGVFSDAILDPQLGDANFHGWQGDVKIPAADLGIDSCFCFEAPKLVFQWNYGESNFQTESFGIQTSATNANSSLLLDPQGAGGGSYASS